MNRLIIALAVLLLGATAACEGSADPSPAPPPSTSPPASTQPTASMTRQEATRLLVRAAPRGHGAQVRAAIAAGADLEQRDAQGRTPLVAATKQDRPGVARLLLEAGADPNAKDDLQDSAFLYAGAEGLTEIVRLTLAHGADVRSTNRFGGTALIPASEHGHLAVIRLLLAAGVPVDHVNDLGWTAVHEAIVLGDGSSRQVETVRLLLDGGADVTIRDRDGVLPRDLAARRGYTEIVDLVDAV